MIVLETYDHAVARGATIMAELAGVGMSGDATDIVAPTVEGPTAAMSACLADAGLAPEDVDYINAHGTGTNVQRCSRDTGDPPRLRQACRQPSRFLRQSRCMPIAWVHPARWN